MTPDQLFYGRALARIQSLMLFLGAAGAVAAGSWRGWRWAAGFLLGAFASYLNFHWFKKMVGALGDSAAGKPPKARVAVVFGLRYLLMGIGAYVILNFSTLSLAAALAGLFVSVAAVILEILYELVYART